MDPGICVVDPGIFGHGAWDFGHGVTVGSTTGERPFSMLSCSRWLGAHAMRIRCQHVRNTRFGLQRAAWLMAMVVATWSEVAPGDPGPSHIQVSDWIHQLNDDNYLVRETATAALLKAGFATRPELLDVAESPNPEVRARARRLLIQIEQGEFDKRLESFAADVEGKNDLTFPGWDTFRQLVGDKPSTRALFVQMQHHERELMAAAFNNQAVDLDTLLTERAVRLINWQRARPVFQDRTVVMSPPLGSCAAALFVTVACSEELSEGGIARVGNLVKYAPLSTSLTSGGYEIQIRRLFVEWIMLRRGNVSGLIEYKLLLMVTHDLREALPFAWGVAQGKPDSARWHAKYRAQAVLAISKLADRQQVLKLEPLLSERLICFQRGGTNVGGKQIPPTTVELRDIALAALVHGTGQKLADYGFQRPVPDSPWLFKIGSLGFETERHRSLALEKWSSWRGAN